MIFNSAKDINRLRKEINRLLSNVFNSIKKNRLLSKGMSKIYLRNVKYLLI